MSTEAYHVVCQQVAQAVEQSHHTHPVKLVVVSKTRAISEIEPLLHVGARMFGENRVQEALEKWPTLKQLYPDICLRLIGPLQSNKIKFLPGLIDAIDSVDRPKLITALADLADKTGYRPPCLLQINTGAEPQKAGFLPQDASSMIAMARQHALDLRGLMCIPPMHESASIHFALLRKIADEHGLEECSMGMSNDYAAAIALGATMVRVGNSAFARPR